MYKSGMCEPDTLVWQIKNNLVIWNVSHVTYLKISFTKVESENFFEFDTCITGLNDFFFFLWIFKIYLGHRK